MHVSAHDAEHARDAGPTKVNIQDANLKDRAATRGLITTVYFEILYMNYIKMHGDANLLLAQLTFLPACLKARANSVVMVLFPTPPFPDKTNITCRTWAMFPSRVEMGGGNWLILPYLPRHTLINVSESLHSRLKILLFKMWTNSKQASHRLSLHFFLSFGMAIMIMITNHD